MNRLTENKIVLVKRKSRLENLVARYNTVSQAKFYIEHLGADFADYLQENKVYQEAVATSYNILEKLGRVQLVDREYVPNFIFGEDDIVVVVGQDGLVANTLKYLNRQLLIGVNPDSARWDGVLLPFEVKNLEVVLKDVFQKQRPIKQVTMAKALLNDGQSIYAVNDLFIGQRTHVSSRYEICINGKKEKQSSSGVIVSTGLGSTGWLKSVLTGASNIINGITEKKINMLGKGTLPWDADTLYFSVREPFPMKTATTKLGFGKINQDNTLRILSQMPKNGVIFSDGIEEDFLQFNSGIEATISIAEKKGHLVI